MNNPFEALASSLNNIIFKDLHIDTDTVNHPAHYSTGNFECIDVMVETQGVQATKDFCVCNALKYIYRHKRKNGLEDIKKAIWYLNKYVELSEDENEDEESENEVE